MSVMVPFMLVEGEMNQRGDAIDEKHCQKTEVGCGLQERFRFDEGGLCICLRHPSPSLSRDIDSVERTTRSRMLFMLMMFFMFMMLFVFVLVLVTMLVVPVVGVVKLGWR